MKKRILSAALCLYMAVMPILTPTAQADDYPGYDHWGYVPYQCTSFVAHCLYTRNGYTGSPPFQGNAKFWGTSGNLGGFTVDQTPAVGAVAWWDGGATGHVAWVKSIENGVVHIEEYNHVSNPTGCHTDTLPRRTNPSTYDDPPKGYIHVKDMAAASLRNLGGDFYAYIRNTHTGQALENRSNNVQLAAASDYDPRQIWYFTHLGYNQYKVTNLYDGRCLDTDGTAVRVMPYAATPNQFWCMYGTEEHTNSVLYYIAPPKLPDSFAADGKVLDVAYGYEDNIPPGRNVQLALSWFGGSGASFINGGPFHKAQTFQIVKINSINTTLAYDTGDDFYARISYLDSYLQIPNSTSETGGMTSVETYNRLNESDPRQIWHFVRQSNGTYQISNEYNGGCLDVVNAAVEDGAKVCTQYRDTGAVTQRWYLMYSPGDSTCRIASAVQFPNPVYSLDVPVAIADTPAANGMTMTVCSWHQNSNQQFTITKVDPPAPQEPEITRDAIAGAAADPAAKTVRAILQNRTAAVLTGAVYSQSGQMLDLATASVPAGGGGATLRFQALPGGCSVKLMLLESGTWNPLCETYRLFT